MRVARIAQRGENLDIGYSLLDIGYWPLRILFFFNIQYPTRNIQCPINCCQWWMASSSAGCFALAVGGEPFQDSRFQANAWAHRTSSWDKRVFLAPR